MRRMWWGLAWVVLVTGIAGTTTALADGHSARDQLHGIQEFIEQRQSARYEQSDGVEGAFIGEGRWRAHLGGDGDVSIVVAGDASWTWTKVDRRWHEEVAPGPPGRLSVGEEQTALPLTYALVASPTDLLRLLDLVGRLKAPADDQLVGSFTVREMVGPAPMFEGPIYGGILDRSVTVTIHHDGERPQWIEITGADHTVRRTEYRDWGADLAVRPPI